MKTTSMACGTGVPPGDPAWRFVQNLISEVRREHARKTDFLQLLGQWRLIVHMLKIEEVNVGTGDGHLDAETYSEFLNEMILGGNRLIHERLQCDGEVDDKSTMVHLREIEAQVEELQGMLREWKPTSPPEKIASLQARIFGG